MRWGAPASISADELVAPTTRSRAPRRAEAASFLEDILGAGAVLATVVEERAAAAGHAPATLKRAKEELGVRSFKREDVWFWEHPVAHTSASGDEG